MFDTLLKILHLVWQLLAPRRAPRSKHRRLSRIEQLAARALFAADAYVAVYDHGEFRFDDDVAEVAYGWPTDQGLMGDWNGNGVENTRCVSRRTVDSRCDGQRLRLR